MNKVKQRIEEIDLMGQEDEEKGVQVVKEISKRDELEAQKSENESLNKLNDRKKQVNLYWQAILKECKRKIKEYEIPKGFSIGCTLTSKGLVVGYRYFTDKMWFMKGIKISANPVYDMQGVDRLLNEALDEIAQRIDNKEKNHTTAGGIILPGGSQ